MQQFQSTLPQREWQAVGGGKPYVINISIHTPTKGVTFSSPCRQSPCTNFNPHSHKGSDNNRKRVSLHQLISIHTPTKGVTGKGFPLCRRHLFQSTLPQREWPKICLQLADGILFQSTLPQREWPISFFIFCSEFQFQSTLPQREWQQFCPI